MMPRSTRSRSIGDTPVISAFAGYAMTTMSMGPSSSSCASIQLPFASAAVGSGALKLEPAPNGRIILSG